MRLMINRMLNNDNVFFLRIQVQSADLRIFDSKYSIWDEDNNILSDNFIKISDLPNDLNEMITIREDVFSDGHGNTKIDAICISLDSLNPQDFIDAEIFIEKIKQVISKNYHTYNLKNLYTTKTLLDAELSPDEEYLLDKDFYFKRKITAVPN